jgi:tRNA U34 2-thiouridine synthase MnmA/TrmU
MTGDDTCSIKFAEPQRAAATGQTAVFYNEDILLGGGTIVLASQN